METLVQAKNMIYAEITTSDPDVIHSYIDRYSTQANQFSELMARTMIDWYKLEEGVNKHDKVAFVANAAYCAIMLHVQSMKLFLSGHIVAAGNLSRQTVESIAMALLFSGKTLNALDRFIDDKYSTKNAVKDLQKHQKALGIRQDAITKLAEAEKFYNNLSHLSKITIAVATSFSQNALYVGASFDEAKINGYNTEIKNRLSLAKVFPSFILALSNNVSTW